MTVLNFPNSPADGDTYIQNNVAYTWDNANTIWRANSAVDLDARYVNVDPGNRDYAEFLNSGANAADYVEPPAPPEPTPEEKLAASGLTVDELKALLGL